MIERWDPKACNTKILFYPWVSCVGIPPRPGFLLLLGRCAGQKKTHVGAGAPTMLLVGREWEVKEVKKTDKKGEMRLKRKVKNV